jgi:6-phosphogluconolactonase
MTVTAPTERIFESAEALAQTVAEWLCGLAQTSGRPFSVCLSGGSTPQRTYERLATPAIASRFPWPRVHWFWGDERFVPHDDPASNYRMAHEALLSRVPIPGGNIHPIPTEGVSPEQAADAYEATLKRYHGSDILAPDRPLFDVTLLGIGDNGHTASLFPGQPALRVSDVRFAPTSGGKASVPGGPTGAKFRNMHCSKWFHPALAPSNPDQLRLRERYRPESSREGVPFECP